MPPIATRRRPAAATKPVQTKKKGGGAVVVVAAVGAAGGLLWWLLSRRRGGGGGPPPADPVVDVGDDQAVILDITSHAEITIPFSVVADNPVNLVWTRTSGPGDVAFSPLGPNQERAEFQTPGTYFLRLTAIDTTDSSAQGFDELVVTVNELLLEPILVPGELKVDGFASYTLTRQLGDTIGFVWPVTNVGNLVGAAFIQLTEGGVDVGTGAPFPIDPGRTVDVGFNPVVGLPVGVHILIARVMEGLPPDGIAVGDPQIITLTVTSLPILAAVGLPTIDGILAPTEVHLRLDLGPVPILWACQNTGGGDGLARLKTVSSPSVGGLNVTGTLTIIPGGSVGVSLLIALDPFRMFSVEIITLTMQDETNVVLGSHTFTLFKN